MKEGFRQSMTRLHTWSGLVFCWIMYFMFITGTLGYFDTEIDHWMKPEISHISQKPLHENIRVGQAHLESQAPNADTWRLFPANSRDIPHLRVFWQGPKPESSNQRAPRKVESLDIETGAPIETRATGGGQTLYRMHYALHYLPRDPAYYFIGIVTLIMFIGLITGIVVHKKIFKDFFTFRPHKGQRSWLDIHNLMSVTTLPFQLMITYSGLIFMLTTWMPLIALGSYGFDVEKTANFIRESRNEIKVERAGKPATLVSLYKVSDNAAARWGADRIRFIEVKYPGDANARVIIKEHSGVSRGGKSLVYDGVSGALLETKKAHANVPLAVADTFIGLHEGLFAGPLLRWLYFVSGLLGAAMIATGAIYWVAKRSNKSRSRNSVGFTLVNALNIGTIVGLPIAVAAYFLANRLLPITMENRADWEVHCMFIVWAICLLHPIKRSAKVAWQQQCWAAAAIFMSIPIINTITTDVGLVSSLKSADWLMAGFDLTALFTGIAFAVAAGLMKIRGTVKKQEHLQPAHSIPLAHTD